MCEPSCRILDERWNFSFELSKTIFIVEHFSYGTLIGYVCVLISFIVSELLASWWGIYVGFLNPGERNAAIAFFTFITNFYFYYKFVI